MTSGFVDVTEIEGQGISQEQLDRMCHRYHWAARDCEGSHVVEVACGAGQGLSLLAGVSDYVVAGDYSPEVLAFARSCVGDTVPLSVFGADALPFADSSFDRVVLFEAIYYLQSPESFFAEAMRVLRPGGAVLLATANKDLYDFHPSPFATRYLGVVELAAVLDTFGFSFEMWGYLDTTHISWRQRILRPVKALASKLGLMPKTMKGKQWLKRLFFGSIVSMPSRLSDVPFLYSSPNPIPYDVADRLHKVIYCKAVKPQERS